MSDTLILNFGSAAPIIVSCQSGGEDAPIPIGEKSSSFLGSERSSIRGERSVIAAVTTQVDPTVKESIKAVIARGAQILCSGSLLNDVPTLCSVENPSSKMVSGLPMWEMQLTLYEVNPDVILSKYLPGDVITGESFTRASVATSIDGSGGVQTAAINAKRDQHWINSVRTTLLEGQRSNALDRSKEFDHANWEKNGVTVTPNATAGPDGLVTAEKVLETATNAIHIIYRGTTTTPSTQQPHIFYLKSAERTWAYVQSNLRDGTIPKSWINLATGAIGTKAAQHTIRVKPRVNGWWEVECVVNSGAGVVATFWVAGLATGDNVDVYPGDVTKGIYIVNGQHEADQLFASSFIATTTSAPIVRNADIYSLPFALPPMEMSVYIKFIELGSLLSAARLWTIANATDTPPILGVGATGGIYQGAHVRLSITPVTSPLAVGPAIGDTVEILTRLFGDGSIDIAQSINGAAPTFGPRSAPLALDSAWSGPLIWLNSQGTVGGFGYMGLIAWKIAAGARSLAKMRAA